MIVALFSVITVRAQSQVLLSLDRHPLLDRVGNALLSYVWYAVKTVWPTNLLPFYPLPKNPAPIWEYVAAGALLLAVTAATAMMVRRRTYLLVGWLWFIGTLVPVIGLMQAGEQGRADRFVYIPQIGLLIFVVWGAHDGLARIGFPRNVLSVSTAAGCIVLAILTFLQAGRWHDSISLWEYAVRAAPENSMAQNYLGSAMLKEGRLDEALSHLDESVRLDADNWQGQFNLGVALERQGRLERAEQHYAAALRVNPKCAFAYLNWGAVCLKQDRLDEAINHFSNALQFDPKLAPAEFNRGVALLKLGQKQAAAERFESALRLDPNLAAAHSSLGTLYASMDRFDEAIPHFRASLQLAPSEFAAEGLGEALARTKKWNEAAEAFRQATQIEPYSLRSTCNLAWALYHAGRIETARACYQSAFRLNPRWPEFANRRAWVLCTHSDEKERDASLALELAEQATQATHGRELIFLDTLAAAHANLGQFDEAVSISRRALELAAGPSQSGLRAGIQRRLALYESRQPYRESPGALKP